MSAEDRDRLFEEALARHLRSDAGAASDTSCLDAETLAAYLERLLLPEEMSAAKSHLVSCARCQEILASLESTQDAHELRDRGSEYTPADSAARSNSEVVEEAPAAPSATTARAKAKENITEFHRKKSSALRWAAPAGAIAAGLLLLVGIRDYRAARQTVPTEPTQIAENRKQDSGVRDYSAAAPEPATRQKSEAFADNELKENESARRYDALRDEMPAAGPSPRSPERSSLDKKAISPAAPPPPFAPPVATLAESQPQESARPRADGDEAGKVKAKTESANAASNQQLDSLQAGAHAQNNQSQSKSRGVVGGANASQPQASGQVQATSGAPMVANESVEVAQMDKDANLPMMSRKAISMLALQPSAASAQNGKSIWKFGEHGSIAHSSDGGKTWQAQFAGVGVTLTSGTAPSKNICWIAGAAGILLRTTDGGKHWQLVSAPISGDLGGVQASDAKHASIWDATHRLTYETSDGGATWRQAPKD
jgi:hypothetical protein